MKNYSNEQKMNFYKERKKDSGMIWVLFLFFGWSYGSLGQMGKQIFFYLTFGGLGFWALYVLFTLNRKIKNYNRKIAYDVGLSVDDILMLGLI